MAVALLPGQSEWIVILIVGLLLFGRRLPEVGRAVGRTLTDFRRGLNDFKRELDSDDSIREARSGLSELKQVVDAPRIATDPRRLLTKLAETPEPPVKTDEAAPTDDDPDGHRAVRATIAR